MITKAGDAHEQSRSREQCRRCGGKNKVGFSKMGRTTVDDNRCVGQDANHIRALVSAFQLRLRTCGRDIKEIFGQR